MMDALILTAVGTVLAAVVESMVRYVRFKNTTLRTLRPALIGSLLWGIGIAALRWDSASPATVFMHGAVGSVLWFVVVFALSRVLQRSAGRASKRRS